MVEGYSKDWVCIYFGHAPVAEMLAQVLEAEGIPVHVPDRNLRAADPFGIGGPVHFHAEVFVARRDEARARELIAAEPTEPAGPNES